MLNATSNARMRDGTGQRRSMRCVESRRRAGSVELRDYLVVHAELLEDVLDVGPDRVLADEQVAADPGVVPAPAAQGQQVGVVVAPASGRRLETWVKASSADEQRPTTWWRSSRENNASRASLTSGCESAKQLPVP
jgi:hypothetical protein